MRSANFAAARVDSRGAFDLYASGERYAFGFAPHDSVSFTIDDAGSIAPALHCVDADDSRASQSLESLPLLCLPSPPTI